MARSTSFVDEREAMAATRNKLAIVAGVSDLTIVLDGQQRLTSLLIGLTGSYDDQEDVHVVEQPGRLGESDVSTSIC